MVMVSSVSVIFDTVYTYSCSFNRGYFFKLEYNIFPGKLKGIAKILEIYRFGIVEYSVRSESGPMIILRAQSYYVPRLSKD